VSLRPARRGRLCDVGRDDQVQAPGAVQPAITSGSRSSNNTFAKILTFKF
jgi:hypothetical protein